MTPPSRYEADVDELVRRSRAIGARRDLVVHGGGNTSSKTAGLDHLGRERPILLIKASGADLATLGPEGLCGLYLDDLLALRRRQAMDDADMVDALMRCVVRPGSPRPSIETLLHAFIPARYVDHVHADAICALTKAPEPRTAVREALGDGVAVVDWIRPGFELAKLAGDLAGAEAIVLAHHGLVTWSDTPAGSVARTADLVERAERYLAGRRRPRQAPSKERPSDDELDLLLTLRGRLSRSGRRVLHLDRSGRAASDRDDVPAVADAGPATADHLMRIRPWSVVIRSVAEVETAVSSAEERYRGYVERQKHRAPPGLPPHDPTPTVALVPGSGTVAAGRNAREARIVGEIAAHSHAVVATAIDAFGTAGTLREEDLFDIDHWPLELAKIARAAEGPELEGRVFVVTGAGGAIGRAVALMLARLGAELVLTDVDRTSLDASAALITAAGREPALVVGDITDARTSQTCVRTAVTSFGGLDGAVSNAGVAVTGALSELPSDEWHRSLAVNATAHFYLVRQVLRALRTQGLGGAIVFVASKNAFSPGAGFGPYSVAKAAEVQLARIAALEGGAIGVRANVVNPDAVFEGSGLWSPQVRAERASAHGIAPDQLEDHYARRNVLGVRVRPDDVANAVAFLLSDRSSRTTGCVITVDGGVGPAFPR